MRRKNLLLLDNLKRKLFIKYEIKNKLYKSLLKNNYISNFYKYQIYYKKSKLNKFENINQTVNRCFKSGRKWYTNKYTKTSRFVFRNESYNGHFPGFSRASW